MTTSTQTLEAVLSWIDEHLEESLVRVEDFLRIPSVGTDPAHDEDTARAAAFASDLLSELGMDSKAHQTPGQPMVMAHDDGPGSGPRILYYGHYDVQPADPLELWDSPPFEPVRVEGDEGPMIVARGSADDKGQLMMFIEAFRAWKAVTGSLPTPVHVLLEGEEESGSESLEPFLRDHVGDLASKVCVISDTGMWDPDTPAITTRLRGIVYLQATLHGPTHDLHSGVYGGAVVNPLNALSRILAQLHDDQGRVQVDGFYDDVEVDEALITEWSALDFDEKGFLATAGLTSSLGEQDRSVLERVWSRPTCDINGIWGGYSGPGAKTVIAAEASCKISCRVVPHQDPVKIMAGLKAFLEARTPTGCRWVFEEHGCNPGICIPTDSPWLQTARESMGQVFDNEAVLIGCGGSLPIVGSFQEILGVDSLLVGFGLDTDRVHSPNENFSVARFRHGVRSHAAMIEAFGNMSS
ncbi:MAG: M20/M25/M40 family metallo-hydrolase [Phycisphaerales bacterium]|nr:M20/M25/M40 family metallo-hydrolase [Phycisphaerales bacterium]